MSTKIKIVLALVVMLSLAGSARAAYTPYFWGNASGDWNAAGTWADHWMPVPPGHDIPSPEARYDPCGVPIQGYEDIAITIGGVTLDVTTDVASNAVGINGAVQLYSGYHTGTSTINIHAGKLLYITGMAQNGLGNDADPAIATGVINVYGTFYCKGLLTPNSKTDTGITNIYDGGSVDVNEWGCNVGFADSNVNDSTGTVNLKGGVMTILAGNLVINPRGCINIEAGTLRVFGDAVALLQGYIDAGRIVAYGGAGDVNAPVIVGDYTVVTAPPIPFYYWNWGYAGNWDSNAIWVAPAEGNPNGIIPTPIQSNGNQCMLLSLNTSLITVTAAGGATGQGACDLLVGYIWGGVVTLRIDAGVDFTVRNYLTIGYASNAGVGAKGVVDLYGTAHSQALHFAGADVNSTGTLNIYDGATYTLGAGGCLIGATWPPSYTVCGTGFINMTGTGSMVINGNPTGAIEMTSKGHIDIEGGALKVLGDYQTLLQGYVNNGWITGYDGDGTINVALGTGADAGYTVVTATTLGAATNPSPTDGQRRVLVNAVLSWTGDPLTNSHDVYFGTDSDLVADAGHLSPEFKGNQTANSYTPPGGLVNGQAYYWRIDEVNSPVVAKGDVWSFVTVLPATISISKTLICDRQITTIPPADMARLDAYDVALIKHMGFTAAKVLLNPATIIDGNTIKDANMWYVDELINGFLDQGVPVILCIHPENAFKQMYLGNNPAGSFTQLRGFYQALAGYLAARWDKNEVVFQLMTEPFGNPPGTWNTMWPQMYDSVRSTMPNHTLIMSGDQGGLMAGVYNDVDPDLRVDPNIYWSFTTYYPYEFAFQGWGGGNAYNPWLKEVPYPTTGAEIAGDYILEIPEEIDPDGSLAAAALAAVNAYLDTPWDLAQHHTFLQPLINWKAADPTSNPKLWCAEFGSIDLYQSNSHGGGPNPPDRIQFINDRRQAFEDNNIGWSYYSYNETFTVLEPVGRSPFQKQISKGAISRDTLVALGLPCGCGCVVDPSAPGDINHDCYINILDVAIMATGWLDCTEPTDVSCL